MPGQFRIEPLGRQHQRDGFQCGHDALDRYLRQQARQDADKHVAAPFVLVQGDDSSVLGYYTLSASSINTADVAHDMARKLPRYPQLPVTLIGRLAVDNRLKRQGRGAFLLIDALRRSLEHAASVAAVAIVVEAKDEQAAAFYQHFRFLALQKNPRRLYLPIKTVRQIIN